jgi:hypothetical protein
MSQTSSKSDDEDLPDELSLKMAIEPTDLQLQLSFLLTDLPDPSPNEDQYKPFL